MFASKTVIGAAKAALTSKGANITSRVGVDSITIKTLRTTHKFRAYLACTIEPMASGPSRPNGKLLVRVLDVVIGSVLLKFIETETTIHGSYLLSLGTPAPDTTFVLVNRNRGDYTALHSA